ncbi:hypothetical protein ACIHEI_28430 [Kitasatospora sp. NPDC051984]|uniref:hypothetical protein n=1 Tax=Kitasatospora sp. NPDC051984 TaxID=3364059 RepID=UPI0037C6B146
MNTATYEEQLAQKDVAIRRLKRVVMTVLLIGPLIGLGVGAVLGFVIGSAEAARTRAEQLCLVATMAGACYVSVLELRAYRDGRSPFNRWQRSSTDSTDSARCRTDDQS